jgi:hypothetical protein
MAEWRLTDFGTPGPRPEGAVGPYDEYAETAIQSEGQLLAELARLRRAGRPTFLCLVAPTKEMLCIGLGPELSGLFWKGPGPMGWHSLAVSPRLLADEEQGFADGNGGFVFEAEQLFPTDEVIEAALHFYRHGEPPDTLQWVEM